MWKFALLAVLALSVGRNIDAVCNQCKNGFTCVSENKFQLCFNNVPNTRDTYDCPNKGDICTHFGQICMPNTTNVVPACRGIQNCVCDNQNDGFFACTSRRTFTMCHNGAYTTTRGTCPQNQLCDVQMAKDGKLPCTNKCIEDAMDSRICDFENPVDLNTTTTTPTVTPTLTSTITPSTGSSTDTTVIITPTPPQNSANAVCATKTVSGRYAYPNDTSCLNYVFCYWQSGSLLGRGTACPTGRYFNAATRNCQATKPAGCN